MKTVVKAKQVVINNKTLSLWHRKNAKGHYLPILEKSVDQMDAMLSHHCKIMVFRLDLRMPEYTETNQTVSGFIKRYRKGLKSMGFKRLGYIWCREQASSDKQHYHVAFMVDANRYQQPHHLIELAEYYWECWTGGSVFIPKSPSRVIRRGDQAAYNECFNRLSYLAKVSTKDKRPEATNDYSASRLKFRDGG